MVEEKKEQVTLSITAEEFEMAKIMAKKECFTSPTAWIRHTIRVKAKGV